jgi:hypothetical protein
MLKTTSIYLAVIALVIIAYLFGAHYGFDQGVQTAEINERVKFAAYGIELPKFSAGGLRTYEELTRRYFLIIFFLTFYLIGKFIKSELISHIICLSFLGFATYQFWQIYSFYVMLIETFHDYDSTTHFSLLRNLSFLVWFVFIIVFSLFIIQITTISKSLYEKSKATPK